MYSVPKVGVCTLDMVDDAKEDNEFMSCYKSQAITIPVTQSNVAQLLFSFPWKGFSSSFCWFLVLPLCYGLLFGKNTSCFSHGKKNLK